MVRLDQRLEIQRSMCLSLRNQLIQQLARDSIFVLLRDSSRKSNLWWYDLHIKRSPYRLFFREVA